MDSYSATHTAPRNGTEEQQIPPNFSRNKKDWTKNKGIVEQKQNLIKQRTETAPNLELAGT